LNSRPQRKFGHWLMPALAGAAVALLALLVARFSEFQRPDSAEFQRPASAVSRPQHADAGVQAAADMAISTPDAVTAADLAPGLSPTEVKMDAPLPRPVADKGLHIMADPAELRVWSNTEVRLRVQNDGVVSYDRYVWHFEDGSDPVSGLEMLHTFAESVRDRHVTVEALRAGQPAVVISRRLPVERLVVVPVDGQSHPAQAAELSAPTGTRLLFAAGPMTPEALAAAAAVARRVHAEVVVATDANAANTLALQLPDIAVLFWPTELASGNTDTAPLRLASNPDQRVTPLHKGARDLGVLTLGELAIVPIDTRAETVSEPQLKQLRDALLAATAYPATVLLTARPLTLLRDGELIADRAYRIYEHALRQQVTVVISSASAVFYDGRFGGQQVVAVGRAQPEICLRLTGTDACQAPSLTVVDVSPRGKIAVQVLTGATFDRILTRQEMPAEAGKVRR